MQVDNSSLTGQHVVVTGASQGIGKAIAYTLAYAGAKVTLMGRRLQALQGAQASLPKPTSHQSITCDVGDSDSVNEAFTIAKKNLGPIRILVNNAGQAYSSPFLKMDMKLWQQMLQVNLTGVFLCTQASLPDMLNCADGGRVINIASTAAQKGYAYVSAYVAAKHGVLGLTRSLALELASKNVTVNAICPGFTETELLENSIKKIMQTTGRTAEQARQELAKTNPQKRLIQPDEVAQVALWLCQKNSASITGQALSVSGGEVMN
jgi:NAD(P)-dependent dehydrogenase (short-subunit alcohol dehydrogenase family)